MLAVIPIAVAVGVLIGRASTGGDAKLIAALKAQKPEIINVGGGAAAGNAQATIQPASLRSDFPLQQGYSVELRTLGPQVTDQATVTQAESAARAKGAKDVGLIVPSDFRVKPRPPSGTYVIYSGAYSSRAKAATALAKLKRAFPAAIVIQVQSVAFSAVTGGGKVLTKTGYGSATQIAGFHATQSQLNAGKQVVTHIQKTEGNSYVNAQRNLPSQISVP